jgi:hypothetical protein
VALGEFSGDVGQQGADLVFRDRHDPADDRADLFGAPQIEGPQKNA